MKMDKTHLEEYGVDVKRYLSYAEIQSIADGCVELQTWSERQQNIDMLVLHFVAGIPVETLEKNGHDYYLQNGMIDAVSACVTNIFQIEEAIKFTESPVRLLSQLAKEIPEFSRKVDEVMKNAGSQK